MEKQRTTTPKMSAASGESGNSFPAARPPQTQFPQDPNRASEAGFTYGEAGPERPGQQMQTPPVNPVIPPPSSAELAQRDENRKQRSLKAKEQKLEDDLEDVTEEIGPRGNYRR
jgi:hypothetical protein